MFDIQTYKDSLAIRNYQPASLKKNVQLANLFLDWVGDISTIDTVKVQDYLIHLLDKGRAVKTVRNHMSAIKVLCDFLAARGYISDNPVHGIKSLQLPQEIPVCLTDSEVKTAYKVAKREHMFCEVTLALNTGLRMAEMRRLKWTDVDLHRKQLIVKIAKGKRPRTVPLNKLSITSLISQKMRFGHMDYVFPGGKGGPYRRNIWDMNIQRGLNWWEKKSLRPLQKAISTLSELPPGRTGRGWHALRHTFATRAILADIDVVKLRDWMGHRKIDTTLKYVHVARHYDPDIELVT